jgi:hypothetical protein
MLDEFETFFQAHQYTIGALGVLANFSAVVVALAVALISQRARRPRISARVYVSKMLHSTLEGKPKPTYVTVSITNKGLLPAQIPFAFFGWRLPFSRDGWMVNPWDYSAADTWVPQKKYPIEIKSRGSETFFIAEKSVFQKSMGEIFKSMNWSQSLRARWLHVVILMDDGQRFKATLVS